jgi:hypothetical protein
LTEIYCLSGMKSFRDDLIDRMKTGWGRFVLASEKPGNEISEVWEISLPCPVPDFIYPVFARQADIVATLNTGNNLSLVVRKPIF